MSWSSGKDSAWTLHALSERNDIEVVGLLTTVTSAFDRVAMHAVRTELLRAQARAVGLPLTEIRIPFPCSNAQYANAMSEALTAAARDGVTAVAFGDLFLEDVRQYREDRMRGTGITPLFPLWGRPTHSLAREMVAAGLRARVTCVDPRQLDACFAGRDLDTRLLDGLPASVDPCGERGEFHTFVYDGPMFQRPLRIRTGEIVERDGFVFADVVRSDPEDTDGSQSEQQRNPMHA
ncbi:MAG: adenine nucleotide alpha hydrolase [Polyangiaceae bacterium]|nr:adenine nucleotide alpha hydrolase [Polyangiaceae bacterium]